MWKTVVGYLGLYECSNLGSVRSLTRIDSLGRKRKGRILKPGPDGYGYLTVVLCKDGKKITRTVHSLVSEAFIGPRPEDMEVCHGINGKLDNSVSNLSYGTRRHNNDDRKRYGIFSSSFPGVCWHKASRKWRAAIKVNGECKHLGLFTCEQEAADAYQKARNDLTTS